MEDIKDTEEVMIQPPVKDDIYNDVENDIIDYDGELDLESLGEEEEDNDSVLSEQIYPVNNEEKLSWQEQIEMIHLRSHLNELDEKVKSCTYETDKTSEELKKCRTQIDFLEKERDDTFSEIQSAEENGNTAAVYRLKSAHERVCKELEGEHQLEEKIAVRLEQTEYELWKAEVEKGKFLLAEDELKHKETQLIREKNRPSYT